MITKITLYHTSKLRRDIADLVCRSSGVFELRVAYSFRHFLSLLWAYPHDYDRLASPFQVYQAAPRHCLSATPAKTNFAGMDEAMVVLAGICCQSSLRLPFPAG